MVNLDFTYRTHVTMYGHESPLARVREGGFVAASGGSRWLRGRW